MVTVNRTFVDSLVTRFKTDLAKVGIRGSIYSKPIAGTKLHRIYVISADWKNLRPSERQDLVWRIADSQLQEEKRLFIALIFTLTPFEAGEMPKRYVPKMT